MKCKDCPWCCIHFPASGMQSDGFVCCANSYAANEHYVELNQDCDVFK